MAQFDIYPNPGSLKADVPYLVAIQNDHITAYTGATVVIPLRAKMAPVPVLAPFVEVPGVSLGNGPSSGLLVLSTAEIFTIDTARLKSPIGRLSSADRAKIKPALDKVIGEY